MLNVIKVALVSLVMITFFGFLFNGYLSMPNRQLSFAWPVYMTPLPSNVGLDDGLSGFVEVKEPVIEGEESVVEGDEAEESSTYKGRDKSAWLSGWRRGDYLRKSLIEMGHKRGAAGYPEQDNPFVEEKYKVIWHYGWAEGRAEYLKKSDDDVEEDQAD